MSPERIKVLFDSFADALRRLEEALKEDITKSSIIVDGTIQRFEFTFELAWKLLRLMLLNEGIKSNTPPGCSQGGLPGKTDRRRRGVDRYARRPEQDFSF
jgi:hypothetical protein